MRGNRGLGCDEGEGERLAKCKLQTEALYVRSIEDILYNAIGSLWKILTIFYCKQVTFYTVLYSRLILCWKFSRIDLFQLFNGEANCHRSSITDFEDNENSIHENFPLKTKLLYDITDAVGMHACPILHYLHN